MPLDGSANPIVPDGDQYIGLFYAYEASGGYVMEQGIATIYMIPYGQINQYDVTQAFQVNFDVRVFNEKLGLYKDASNIGIIESSYNNITNSFPNDSVNLSAPEFRLGVSESNILSVGQYTTLYSDFETLLNAYFGFPQGFTSLFSLESQININNGIFDASAMVNLMNYSALNASGEYINTMTGDITIKNVNALLRFACQQNPFNNRTTQTPKDGFINNDLIYVPTGTTVTLVANFVNTDSSTNYITILPDALVQIQAQSGDFTNGDYSQVTTFNETSIVRVVKVPLFIRLSNLSTRELYEPNTQIDANFELTMDGVTSPITDSSGNLYLSNVDLTILLYSVATSIGVNQTYLSILSHSVFVTGSRNIRATTKNKDFANFRKLVLSNLRTTTYTVIAKFHLYATLVQLNQSTGALQQYTTAGEFINTITNVFTNSIPQQALVQTIKTASLSNPYSSLSNITTLGGIMEEVNVATI